MDYVINHCPRIPGSLLNKQYFMESWGVARVNNSNHPGLVEHSDFKSTKTVPSPAKFHGSEQEAKQDNFQLLVKISVYMTGGGFK